MEITGYERHQDGHGFEVRWPLPERGRWERCGHEERAHSAFQISPQAIRDLDAWGQPSFWISQAPFHRCARCNYRQHVIPPFQRKDTASTYRLEPFVLRSLIGSTAEDGGRRRGISVAMVERIVVNQLAEDRRIDPQRVITDCGQEELSLTKRHRRVGTGRTDRRAPTRLPRRARTPGQDTAAAPMGGDRHAAAPRPPIRTPRVDRGSAAPAVAATRRKHSRSGTDRLPGAPQVNAAVQMLRKR